MELTDEGVDVYLDIDNDYDEIPADAIAVVGNRSAVGEQYVELQPQVDTTPYLERGLRDRRGGHPHPDRDREAAHRPLEHRRVGRQGRPSQTTVTELGAAFGGTGEDLQRIIDTGNSFIEDANENFDVTTALIRDSNTVLHGQIASTSAIKRFARDLSLFSGTLAGSDEDLREVIDNGSATANQLRTFLEDNEVDLGELINNLVTTGEVVVKHLDGVEQILVIYPYVVEGGFTVVSKSPDSGLYDAHFGMILTQEPHVCKRGYEGTDDARPAGRQQQADERERPLHRAADARATPAAPRTPPARVRPTARPVVASYDPDSGRLRWGDKVEPALASPGQPAPQTLGEESWKWLFLQPLTRPPE